MAPVLSGAGRMRKGWRFVFWLGVIAVGAAIWMSWWAAWGFWIPICRDASGAEGCLSYDEIGAWASQLGDAAWNVAEFANHWAALIAALSAVFLAIFTWRLWLSTHRLWGVTNKTLEHTERTTRKELRAYISVEPLGINEYIGHNYLIGHYQIRNVGKLPARDVTIYSTIGLDPNGERRDFPVGAPRASPTVLQPGATMEFGSQYGFAIPADQLDANEPLKLSGYLYVWGEVLYTDEFKTAGWTAFCHRYPCDMFGMAEDKETRGRSHYRSIDRKFARYHEQAGNEAG
jgi:hypothetical protein